MLQPDGKEEELDDTLLTWSFLSSIKNERICFRNINRIFTWRLQSRLYLATVITVLLLLLLLSSLYIFYPYSRRKRFLFFNRRFPFSFISKHYCKTIVYVIKFSSSTTVFKLSCAKIVLLWWQFCLVEDLQTTCDRRSYVLHSPKLNITSTISALTNCHI